LLAHTLNSHLEKGVHMIHIRLESRNRIWNEQIENTKKMALCSHPILLQGESGSGKDVMANYIHQHSLYKAGPFVSVNCSALNESLIESELFGHIKGAFTGAINNRKGAFEESRGGTLFLDEIGDLPISLQPKLLRAIENQEIRPIGTDQTIKTESRIICATNVDLVEKISKKEFRSDLLFRINVLNIHIPPLRQRPEDLIPLLSQLSNGYRLNISNDALEQLRNHVWPGNIRELKNFISRAKAIHGQKIITKHHLTDLLNFKQEENIKSKFSHLSTIKQIERDLIIQGLRDFYGNQRAVSKALGVPKSTLHDKIKKYEINAKQFSRSSSDLIKVSI
jgi:transcriptional regulator with PAS, ATPase and Fis domain